MKRLACGVCLRNVFVSRVSGCVSQLYSLSYEIVQLLRYKLAHLLKIILCYHYYQCHFDVHISEVQKTNKFNEIFG